MIDNMNITRVRILCIFTTTVWTYKRCVEALSSLMTAEIRSTPSNNSHIKTFAKGLIHSHGPCPQYKGIQEPVAHNL